MNDPTTRCASLGICVCSKKGRALDKVAERVITQIKGLGKRGARSLDWFRQSFCVVRVTGTPRAKPKSAISKDVVPLAEGADLWLHLAFANLSPWTQHVMEVRPAGAPPGEPPSSEERVYVAAHGRFASLHKALQPVASCANVQVRFYLLEDSLRNLGDVSAHVVPLVSFPGLPGAIPILGTGTRGPSKGAGGPAAPAGDPDAEEGSGGASEGEDVEVPEGGDAHDAALAPDESAELLLDMYDLPPPLPPPDMPPPDDVLDAAAADGSEVGAPRLRPLQARRQTRLRRRCQCPSLGKGTAVAVRAQLQKWLCQMV